MNPTLLGLARSLLFVPGDRPERFTKAQDCGADVVVLDLEDAVRGPDKDSARDAVVAFLGSTDRQRFAVRTNAVGTSHFEADCRALRLLGPFAGVMLPKADGGALGAAATRLPGIPVLALVETARGVLEAGMVAADPATCRLAFGSVDFGLDTGAAEESETMAHARAVLVVTSAAAGLPGPVAGVTTRLDDPALLADESRAAARSGYTGKLCIHPKQVVSVNAAFTPTQGEIERARRIVAADTRGAEAVDGEMVDQPVRDRARALLRRATIFPAPESEEDRA